MSAAVSPVRMEEVVKIRLVDTVAAVHQGGPERTVTKVTVLLIFLTNHKHKLNEDGKCERTGLELI